MKSFFRIIIKNISNFSSNLGELLTNTFESVNFSTNHKYIFSVTSENAILVISAIVIMSLSLFSWLIPLFSFITASTFSSLLLFLSLPFPQIKPQQIRVIVFLITLLHKYHVLNFLAVLYIQFFFVPNKLYKKRLYSIFGISLVYLFISRWYFIHTKIDGITLSVHLSLLVFLVLFIGICISYFRFLLNIALFIVPLSVQHYRHLLAPSVLYVFGEGDDDQDEPKKPLNLSDPVPKKSFINIDRSRHYYRQQFNGTHSNTFRYAGFCIGLCTLGATTAAAYYSMQQAEYGKQQAYETRREADVAAVDAGLITKEEYFTRHPQDRKI